MDDIYGCPYNPAGVFEVLRQNLCLHMPLIEVNWKLKKGFISNSYFAPIGGIVNFNNEDSDSPYGYDGWRGNIQICTQSPIAHIPIDRQGFNQSLVHVIGGNQINICQLLYNYEICLFDQDFPNFGENQIMSKLGGGTDKISICKYTC